MGLLLGKQKRPLDKMEQVFPDGEHKAPFIYERHNDNEFDRHKKIHFCVYCANCGAGLCAQTTVVLNEDISPVECNVVIEPCSCMKWHYDAELAATKRLLAAAQEANGI